MTERRKTARQKFSLPCLLGDGALLLCALLGLLYSFLSLYSFPLLPGAPEAGTQLPWTSWPWTPSQVIPLAVLFALIALAVWSLPRFRLPVSTLLELVWLGAAFWFWKPLGQGARLAWHAMLTPFFERVLLAEPPALTMRLTAAQQEAAVATFLIMVMALLALLIGWAVVCARRWWLVVFLTLPPLLPGLLSDVYPFWPAFIVLLACWFVMLLSGLCRWARNTPRGWLTLISIPCVAALLAGLMLAAPPADYTRPQWAVNAEATLLNWGNRYFARWDSGLRLPGFSAFVGGAQPVNLSSAGPLNYSGRTVLRVTAGYSGHALLRGASMTHYTDSGWEPMTAEEYGLYLQPETELPVSTVEDGAQTGQSATAPVGSPDPSGGELPASPLLFPDGTGNYSAYTVTVQNVGASGGCLYVPYQLALQDFDALGLRLEQDSYVARKRGEWTHTLAVCPDALTLHSHSYSYSLDGDPVRRYSDFVTQMYLEVPNWMEDVMYSPFPGNADYGSLQTQLDYRFSVPISLLSSSDITTLVNATRLGYANAVTSLLDDLCEYDPDTPVTPAGEDFVTYFLTESHRGYCMHFASAATLMLRQLGVPARYVSGFAADLEAGRTVNVPDYAAHAWVEIYLENYGWYPVDVTPDYVYAPAEPDDPEGSQAPDATPSPSPVPSDEPTLSPSQAPDARPSQAPDSQPSQPAGPGGSGGGAFFSPRVLLWPILAAAAALLLWLGQHLPKRRRTARLAAPDLNRAALDCYRWLTRLARWDNSDVAPEALRLAQKARFSQHSLTEEERQVMAGLFRQKRARLAASLPLWKRLPFLYLWGRPQ